ncbi:50S ribosomal protein L4 [Botrimarina sp.]|uniref:50S ribosomal protein L4 n=1 Tax=Botrimarina sp. TaxID=2795802 RepID=UPI0032ECB3E3
MPKLTVHDRKGAKVGTYSVEPEDFARSINKQLLHDAVVMYQANLRQGTHKTKSRGEVAGSTKKMYRQKGTGNARAGSKRSGIRRGGGHIFAIKPRDYSYRMPRKALQLATRMALASKVADDEMVIVDDLAFDAPKTREMASILRHLGVEGDSILVATDGLSPNVYKSARNIQRVSVSPASDLNALSLLSAKRLVVTKSALDKLKESAAQHKKNGAASEASA